MTRGKKGSAYEADAETHYRLRRWHHGCLHGWSTREIAEDLGIPVKTLRRCVQRARAHGNPQAIVHPNAARYAEDSGFSHIVSHQARTRLRRARRRRAQEADTG